jgi:DNA polymerase-3 subunit epsilon
VDEYAATAVAPFQAATAADVTPLVESLLRRIESFARVHRYEEAASVRTRLAVLLRATIRMQRLRSLTGIEQMVAARPADGGGWEFAVIRFGRLAGAGTSPPRVHPQTTIDAAVATAETVRPGVGPTPAATAEETERLLAWLERPGTRLVSTTDGWALPVDGAARFAELLRKADAALETRLSL